MPSVATRLVGVVDFFTGAAWSAMPAVATRLIGVVDVCCLHTRHVLLRPAVAPSLAVSEPFEFLEFAAGVGVARSSLGGRDRRVGGEDIFHGLFGFRLADEVG